MSVTWSGEGPALLLALDRSDATPLGHHLQDQLRAAVRDGRLRAGERLPSSRRLSEELRVSRGMVVTCYEQLVAEGYLVARPAPAPGWPTGCARRPAGHNLGEPPPLP
jgi:GntR family transcriptional regulator/MocR family aminotransferase